MKRKQRRNSSEDEKMRDLERQAKAGDREALVHLFQIHKRLGRPWTKWKFQPGDLVLLTMFEPTKGPNKKEFAHCKARIDFKQQGIIASIYKITIIDSGTTKAEIGIQFPAGTTYGDDLELIG